MDNIATANLAKIGNGNAWHILAGHVTDDIMKTYCGLRGVPTTFEPGIDARAVRHRGANVCANCRDQLAHNQKEDSMSSITNDLQACASEAADSAASEAAHEATPKPGEAEGGSSRASKGGTATKPKRQTRSSAKGGGKLSAIKAAEEILRKEGKPLHVKELTEKILAMPNTKLGGKTPDATVGAILAVNSKTPGSVFRRTKPGTYAIRKGK